MAQRGGGRYSKSKKEARPDKFPSTYYPTISNFVGKVIHQVKQGWDLIGPAADIGREFFGCRYEES